MSPVAEIKATLDRLSPKKRSSLSRGHDSVLFTRRGRRKAYLVDATVFEAMQQRLTVLEGLALGEQDVRDGRLVPQAQAKHRMARWLK